MARAISYGNHGEPQKVKPTYPADVIDRKSAIPRLIFLGDCREFIVQASLV
jgi:hypothetical protein